QGRDPPDHVLPGRPGHRGAGDHHRPGRSAAHLRPGDGLPRRPDRRRTPAERLAGGGALLGRRPVRLRGGGMSAQTADEAGKLSVRRILPPVVTGQEIVLLAVIAVLWVLLGFFTPAFLTLNSIGPLLVDVAPVALIGVGMTFVIITAGIDVSVADRKSTRLNCSH